MPVPTVAVVDDRAKELKKERLKNRSFFRCWISLRRR